MSRVATHRAQTHLESLLESGLNTATGFGVAYATYIWVVNPLFGLESTHGDAFWITCIFTVASIVRQYLWRRFFNHRMRIKL